MSSPAIPAVLQNPDLVEAYHKIFDALGTAYWDASDIESKDLIHGTQSAIGDIITALDEGQIAANTDAFIAITPKIKAVNDALKSIKDSINKITKNIDTAAAVLAAANKVLSYLPL